MPVRHQVWHQFGSLWVRGVIWHPLGPHLTPGWPLAPLNLLKVPTEISQEVMTAYPLNCFTVPPPPRELTLPKLISQESECWICNWECLYCDSSQEIRWNIAWALRKSLGLWIQDFPWAQAIFHCISLLLSQYRYSIKQTIKSDKLRFILPCKSDCQPIFGIAQLVRQFTHVKTQKNI